MFFEDDPDREEFMQALRIAMIRHPDMRAAQIIVNCLPPEANQDPYYFSDASLAVLLRRY